MADLESDKVTALKAQVAKLTKEKAEWKAKALTLFLHSDSVKPAGDALAIFDDSEFAPKGMYCRYCLENEGRFTILPLEWGEIPRAESLPRSYQCPFGHRILSIRWENR